MKRGRVVCPLGEGRPDRVADLAQRWVGVRAEEFGVRNGVAGELVVRLRPAKVDALRDIAD